MKALIVLLLVLAVVAGIYSFGAVVAAGVAIARVLFWIFVVLLIVALAGSLFYRSRRGPVA